MAVVGGPRNRFQGQMSCLIRLKIEKNLMGLCFGKKIVAIKK